MSTTCRSRSAVDQLLQRGAEGGDELRGQLLDEADGVGEEDGATVRQLDAPRERVQGGEELVLDEDVGAGEGAHEGALAGVGVADEGDDRHARRAPAAAGRGRAAADGLDLALEAGDAVADEAAVGLELRLAGAAGADGALRAARGGSTGRRGAAGGTRYWASSTWRRPSRVWARLAKMSRMRAVRSRTLTLRASSRLRCCDGRELVVEDDDGVVEGGRARP